MAALVQTYPAQQTSTPVSLMQPRSQSSSGAYHNNSTNSPSAVHHHPHSKHNTGRSYRDAVAGTTGHRGTYSPAPTATYAFTSTPGLATSKSSNPKVLRPADRSNTAGRPEDSRHGYTSLEAISSDSSLKPPQSSSSSRSTDDLAAPASKDPTRPSLRPLSTATLQPPAVASPSPSRPSPDRYRKVNRTNFTQSAQPSGSGMAAVSAVYANTTRSNSSSALPQITNQSSPQQAGINAPFIGDYTGQLRSQSVDDIHTYRSPSATQRALQDRRRSVGPASLNTAENFQNFLRKEMADSQNKNNRPASPAQVKKDGELKAPLRPGSRRTGSTDSSASGASSRGSSASNRNSVVSNVSNPSQTPSSPHEINPANVPPRGSSTDVNKRVTAPSPLSKPVDLLQDTPKPSTSHGGKTATEHLTALNDGQKKGMKNRLRRAFSFGSAAELRKATAVNNLRGEEAAERARARQDKFREQQDAEQERIAQRQEASGLGENIYSGQGNFFTGSTDNISVSSTASSASIMIRKMGKNMKRTSRSFVGLFRPKSITGVEAASGPVDAGASTGQVSMITVEAEREKVNVNARPSESDGGTDFPKLERNSIDTGSREFGRRGSVGDENRRSFIGAERERAEILATMKKGILKRSGSASPIIKAQDKDLSAFQLPEIPHVAGENQPPGSPVAVDDDYFSNPPKLTMSSNSAPASPNSMAKYSVSFSPRITFHDTWPPGEYDRRGEVATCNRLTPMLAQQIKEELNTFKMEMDVHEESKVYTHFF